MTIKLNYKLQLNISIRRADSIENIDPAVIFRLDFKTKSPEIQLHLFL